jgi:hypothetical protein
MNMKSLTRYTTLFFGCVAMCYYTATTSFAQTLSNSSDTLFCQELLSAKRNALTKYQEKLRSYLLGFPTLEKSLKLYAQHDQIRAGITNARGEIRLVYRYKTALTLYERKNEADNWQTPEVRELADIHSNMLLKLKKEAEVKIDEWDIVDTLRVRLVNYEGYVQYPLTNGNMEIDRTIWVNGSNGSGLYPLYLTKGGRVVNQQFKPMFFCLLLGNMLGMKNKNTYIIADIEEQPLHPERKKIPSVEVTHTIYIRNYFAKKQEELESLQTQVRMYEELIKRYCSKK